MSQKLTSNIPYKEVIVNLFMEGGWHKLKIDRRKRGMGSIRQFLDESIHRDVLGNEVMLYRLNSYGRTVARLIMMEYGWEPEGSGGIAVEVSEWDHVKFHTFSKGELSKAMANIAKMGGVVCDIKDDWRGDGFVRVIIKDIDRAIARISSKIEWEIYQKLGGQYLIDLGWSKEMVWLWIEYFDNLRREMRKIPYQQEFIIWGS